MALERAYVYCSLAGQWCLLGGGALCVLGMIIARLGLNCLSGVFVLGLIVMFAGTMFMFVASLLRNRLIRRIREKDQGSGAA